MLVSDLSSPLMRLGLVRMKLYARIFIFAAAIMLFNTATLAMAPVAEHETPVAYAGVWRVSPAHEVVIPSSARCPEWWSLAKRVGWKTSLLPKLDYVIWKESRCLSSAFFKGDPNGGSHGLTQINGFWCRPSRYYPNGYLQDAAVLDSCKDLYVPKTNLRAALIVFEYANGWSPWGL